MTSAYACCESGQWYWVTDRWTRMINMWKPVEMLREIWGREKKPSLTVLVGCPPSASMFQNDIDHCLRVSLCLCYLPSHARPPSCDFSSFNSLSLPDLCRSRWSYKSLMNNLSVWFNLEWLGYFLFYYLLEIRFTGWVCVLLWYVSCCGLYLLA